VSEAEAVEVVVKFVEANEVQTLNVAGPRESGWPLGYAYALAVMGEVVREMRQQV
jgi:Circularly permutated YpsA SLOG family